MVQIAAVQTSSWQEWEGRVVGGRFTLLECLECSEESAVYLTKMHGANALLKLLRADTPNADAQVAAWELASRLSHRNLVRIFETGTWHADEELDMYFAVTEYCEESLAQVLQVRPLTPDETRAMLTPLLDALQYLHEQGVVHGHLNPANILAHGDQLKLSTTELRRNGDARRSSIPSAYDVPEKASGRCSFSGDIWSLGMTLCEALTKQLPLLGKDGRPQLAAEIPAPFDAIVKRCLAGDGDGRISLNAIRDLLNRPVDDRSGPDLQGNATSVDVRTTRPTASKSALDIHVEDELADTWTNRRAPMIAAVAFLLLIAILIGVRITHKSADHIPSAAVTASQSGTAASVEKSPTVHHDSSLAAKPGTVVREVLPEVAVKARSTIQGTVKAKVRLTVDAQGRVLNASLATKSPSAYFDRIALQAARQWSFSAPVRGGRPQSAQWIIRFEFRRSGTRATAQQFSPA
jgi:eukaryotic-like serine/threonine-protein kinase